MKKYQCTYSLGPGKYTYFVIVISDSEQHAKEMATGCTREKNTFSNRVDVDDWNVSVVDTGYSGDAKVVDYYKS